MSNSLQPYELQPARLLCPWDSPGKNIGMDCHALLQGIFLTQALNLCPLCPLHGSQDLPDTGTEPVSPTSPAFLTQALNLCPLCPLYGSHDLPDPGTEPVSPTSPAFLTQALNLCSLHPLHGSHFTTTVTWEAHIHVYSCQNTRDYVPKSVHLTMNFTLLKFKMVGD